VSAGQVDAIRRTFGLYQEMDVMPVADFLAVADTLSPEW
jgi:hypothetical protein